MQTGVSSIDSARTLRVVTALYSGVVLAGLVTIAVAGIGRSAAVALPLPALSPIALGGTFAIGFLVGTTLGVISRPIGTVAYLTAVAAYVLGSAVRELARTQYATAQTGDEPSARLAWTPPGRPRLEALMLVLWVGAGILSAVVGDWPTAIFWSTLGVLWAGGRILEGGWPIDVGATPEIRVHEAGLVTRRPFTAEFVPWESVDRVRLREGELVLDRGLFDLRFDSEDLDDATAALAAIERQFETPSRPGPTR